MAKTNGKVNIAVLIMSAVILVCLIAAPVFAVVLFSSNVPFGGSVDVDAVFTAENATELNVSYSEQDLKFTAPGDKRTVNLSLRNKSSTYLRYYYGISIIGAGGEVLNGDDTGLESAVLVYYNGEYRGTLAELCAAGEALIDKDTYILYNASNTAEGVTETDTLVFELHTATSEAMYKSLDGTGKTVAVKIVSYAATPDFTKNMFVASEADFVAAVGDINSGLRDGKIVLVGDVSLTGNYTINYPCTVDFLGRTVTGGSVTFAHTGTTFLTSSKAYETASSVASTTVFDINNASAVLDIGDALKSRVFVTATSYDSAAAARILTDKFRKRIGNGIKSGSTVDFLGGMTYCPVVASGADYSYADGNITANATAVTKAATITACGREIAFRIVGIDESAISDILNDELKHIPDVIVENGAEVLTKVTYDLFLPVALPAKNASIEWTTSNASVMNNSGKIQPDIQDDHRVTLTAYIRINDAVYTEQFTFNVYNQNNETRFASLMAALSPMSLAWVRPASASEVILPSVSGAFGYSGDFTAIPADGSYSGSDPAHTNNRAWTGLGDYNIESITYSVGDEYTFVTVAQRADSGWSVQLNQATFATYAQINVTVRFNNDDEIYSGVISVNIALGANEELLDEAFDYVDSELAKIDVLQNILATRAADGMAGEKGDFKLPSSYNDYFEIFYFIPSSDNGIISNTDLTSIDVTIGGNTTTYPNVLTKAAGEELYTVKINAEKFYTTESGAALGVLVRLKGDDANSSLKSRTLTFNVPAAIHNDSEGFSNTSVFYSVKYQVYQQLLAKGLVGENNSGFTILNGVVTMATGKYILLNDIEQCDKLYFANGSTAGDSNTVANELIRIVTWATAPTVYSYSDGIKTYSNNGKDYITDNEKGVIKAFCVSAGMGDADFDNLWDSITTTSTGYVVDDGYELNQSVNTLIKKYSGTYRETDFYVYFKYNELMQWATNEQDFPNAGNTHGGDSPNSGYMTAPYWSYKEDQLDTISKNESDVIKNFWTQINSNVSTVGDEFAAIWDSMLVWPSYLSIDGREKLIDALLKLDSTDFKAAGEVRDGHYYTYISSLDGAAIGLAYFTSLKELCIYGSSDSNLPIFSSSSTVTTFFNRICTGNISLTKLVMQNCSLRNFSSLSIANIGKLQNLTYIDLSGNSGIPSVSALTDLKISGITYVNINGIDANINEFKTALATIKRERGTAVELLYTSNGSTVDYSASSDELTAFTYLGYMNEKAEVTSQSLQLSQSLSGTSGITWRLETGNPIAKIDAPISFGSYTTVTASDRMDLLCGAGEYSPFDYYYIDDGNLGYTSGKVYTLTKNADGKTGTLGNPSGGTYGSNYEGIKADLSTLRITDTANTHYVYYNGATVSSIDKIDGGYFSSSYAFALVAPIEPNSLIQINVSRSGNWPYTYTHTITVVENYSNNTGVISSQNDLDIAIGNFTPTPGFYFYTGATVSSSHTDIGYYSQNTLYRLDEETDGTFKYYRVYEGTSPTLPTGTSMDGILTSALGNVSGYYGNYYYYTGGNFYENGVIKYANGHLYKLFQDDGNNFYFTDVHDKASTVTNITTIENLRSIAFNATDSLGSVYYYTGNTTGTYETNCFYELSKNETSGVYYLKKWGDAHLELRNGNTNLLLYNDRIYTGSNYAGTGGSFDVNLTATIQMTDGGTIQSYKRYYVITIKG